MNDEKFEPMQPHPELPPKKKKSWEKLLFGLLGILARRD